VTPNDAETDDEIAKAVRDVRAGNKQAFAEIVTEFQGPLLTLCTAILRDHEAAEDLAQDVFVRAFQRLDTFDERKPMKPWLVKVAYRLAQETGRARSRQTARERAAAKMQERSRNKGSPVARAVAAEHSDILWQSVHALPVAERVAVVLYYREDLSVKDVAAVMGISPGTVKTHLFRARSRIHADLQARGFDRGDIP
jgi:RNA polymerase sigma-70 factor (ECF subfamily)